MKLFHILLGCTPPGRFTEQHDVFFGIAPDLKSLKEDIITFWPEAGGKIHVDAWREVNFVDGYKIEIVPRINTQSAECLFFLNLGGYKQGNFTEFHFQKLVVAASMGEAVQKIKLEPFYKEYNLPPFGQSHIDNKYLLDIDDVHLVADILPVAQAEKYSINITKVDSFTEDVVNLGYLKLDSL